MNVHKVFLASVLVLLFVGGSQKELLTSAHINNSDKQSLYIYGIESGKVL